jgi:rubrerythrin
MVGVLRRWQGLERQAMSDTAEIMERTSSPFIRLVMEIIRHDSLMHHRVQQFLIDTLTKQALVVSREEVGDIWEAIEAHDAMERKTIALAEELLAKPISPVHKQLLEYLLADEKKHDGLLQKLNDVKKGMSQASGG